jgi:hypothetical protein
MIQVSGVEGRLGKPSIPYPPDLLSTVSPGRRGRTGELGEIDEALWLVPAFLPQQACTRGWRVWFELANLWNQYPVTPAERHQDEGRFGGVQALCNS